MLIDLPRGITHRGYVKETRDREEWGKIHRVHTVSPGEQDRHINLKAVVRGFYFRARAANKSRGAVPECGNRAEKLEISWTIWKKRACARFPPRRKVAPLIIICRSEIAEIESCARLITTPRTGDKAGRKEAKSSHKFSTEFIRPGNFKPPFGCRLGLPHKEGWVYLHSFDL